MTENKEIVTEEVKLEAEEIKTKKRAKVHSIVVQKGGVGKTILTSNLGYVMSKMGKKVLLIDHDSQASLTGICNVDINSEKGVSGIADLYADIIQGHVPTCKEDIEKYILRPTYPASKRVDGKLVSVNEEFGFDLLPADIMLAEMEIVMTQKFSSCGMMLNMIIEKIQEFFDYDYIFIDCAPGLSIGTYNAIGASLDGVIIPCTMEIMTVRGVESLIIKVAEAQEAIGNKAVHKGVLGIVMNQYYEKRRVDRAVSGEIAKYFLPIKIFKTSIPESTKCKTATYMGILYSQNHKGAEQAFTKLAKEIIKEDERRENETESYIVGAIGENYEKLHQEELKNNYGSK